MQYYEPYNTSKKYVTDKALCDWGVAVRWFAFTVKSI
jgi:hypothetical protein